MASPTRAESPVTLGKFAQRFSATPGGARLARHLALHQLDEWGVPYGSAPSEDIATVVAELAANAVTHGRVPGRDFALVLRPTATSHVRVEVTDTRTTTSWPLARAEPAIQTAPAASTVRPQRGAAGPALESGRGLLLVSALSARWGVTDNAPAPGKTVWAEVRLPDLYALSRPRGAWRS